MCALARFERLLLLKDPRREDEWKQRHDRSFREPKMKLARMQALALLVGFASQLGALMGGRAAAQSLVGPDGTVKIPATSVPLSRYMSDEAKRKFVADASKRAAFSHRAVGSIEDERKFFDAYYEPVTAHAKTIWPVRVENEKIRGVSAQVITPSTGSRRRNARRVLINLHGGGFVVGGGGIGGLVESIPVAGVMGIKVVSIDYRMAPEFHYPAASEDVAAVYRELLKQHRPEEIGMFGCSAGGILTAMAVAWFQHEKLPRPGAIGLFGSGAFASSGGPPADLNAWGGDSRYTAPLLLGQAPLNSARAFGGQMDYTAHVAKDDPLASPALSPGVLRRFPPTLLLTGTRAADLGAAVETHRRLVRADVRAELHVWDGMDHCFFYDPDLPESREVYDVVAKFFDTHLAR